ncbi:MAG: NAD(P)/FAD-dependent oxidoreductase [Roseovarius sp.]
MSTSADIVIIGGGIAGISAAARLAPDARVIVLEREAHLAYHSTGRSAAVFILNYGNATLRALNKASVGDMQGALLGQSVLSPRGELLMVRPGEEAHRAAFLQGASGVDVLTPAQACAIVPALKPASFESAIHEADAQDIDVDRLLQGCARLARDAGAEIVVNAGVIELSRTGDTWQVQTQGATYSAPVVINAAGAWADQLGQMAGCAAIGLQPKRRSAVMMALPDNVDARHWPVIGSISEDWYAKPDGTRLMISPADEDPVAAQDAWPDDMVLAEGLYRFEQMVDLPIVKPSHSWAGLRSFVADKTPVCGFDPEQDGFFWLAGQGGYGVQTSPALSQLTADLVLGRDTVLDGPVVSALSPARLAN